MTCADWTRWPRLGLLPESATRTCPRSIADGWPPSDCRTRRLPVSNAHLGDSPRQVRDYGCGGFVPVGWRREGAVVAREFSKVGVVGLGTMGAGIAEVLARYRIDVVGVEVDEAGVARQRQNLETSSGWAPSGNCSPSWTGSARRTRCWRPTPRRCP